MAGSTTSEDASKYLDPKVLEKIKQLDVRARLVVEGFITGQHKSPFSGFAVEFAGHREYAAGDELKHIDWKVWSKTDRLYIKEYEEETNLNCTIIVDASKSMGYGSDTWTKFDYAATAAASLTHLLQGQQDVVGLVTFTNKVTLNLPPSGRAMHLKRLVHELDQMKPDDKTDVGNVFLDLAQQIRKRGMVILISDLFADLDQLRASLQAFRLRKNEVVVMHVMHDDELTFPFDTHTRFLGLESDDQVHADPRALRKTYLDVVENYLKDVRKVCSSLGADYELMNTKDTLDAVLSRYLASRQRLSRRSRNR
ncbi:MAG: DUF58 domain-containing protein [Verrucomicrobiales bacterium]|jgi:uncharacterized protein (DUF58 family)|nr:DUF58 domain-containing protein [Verrucomicrobiales bacterium]MDF1785601.1 DUF58 domain-containing protein [Verrucomicrobiales bacterium]